MMVTGFETIKHELTEAEIEIVPFLISGFKKHGPLNKIKAPEIVGRMNDFFFKNDIKYRMTDVKLRRFVNYIRSNSLLPLIATGEGYFVCDDRDILLDQIKSLNERAASIRGCAAGLENFLKPHFK